MVQKQVQAVRVKRVFSEEFQRDAVRLVTGEGDSIAAAAKAVGDQSLRKRYARYGSPAVCVRRGRFGR